MPSRKKAVPATSPEPTPTREYVPPPVKGYRNLSQDEVDLMNEIKNAGERLGRLVRKLEKEPNLDFRFVALGKTQLQTGIMYLVRSVAQPTSF